MVGYGFASIGRYGQAGLIRERFAPRLREAATEALLNDHGTNLDPFRAWTVMMAGEKPGGHGERCVAVGTLDMALWDAAAKIAELPLHQFLAGVLDDGSTSPQHVPAYAGGGYPYPDNDIAAWPRRSSGPSTSASPTRRSRSARPPGPGPPAHRGRHPDLDPGRLAVDAMNTYDAATAMTAAAELAAFGLWWFEDVCDPLDFDTQALVAAAYASPVAAGEALFSVPEARAARPARGLRRDRDFLSSTRCTVTACRGTCRSSITSPTGLAAARLLATRRPSVLPARGRRARTGRRRDQPAGIRPSADYPPQIQIADGFAELPDAPGIGFELHDKTRRAFGPLLAA